MTRIKEAIAKLEAMKKDIGHDTCYGVGYCPACDDEVKQIDSILADLNVHDLDWKPS